MWQIFKCAQTAEPISMSWNWGQAGLNQAAATTGGCQGEVSHNSQGRWVLGHEPQVQGFSRAWVAQPESLAQCEMGAGSMSPGGRGFGRAGLPGPGP